MPDKPYISVVVPVLNEEENVETLYQRVRDVLVQESSRYEIIFVDDGSTDGTAAKIASLNQKDSGVKLVGLSRNFGHQLALTAGLDHAEGDLTITMDADLQHPPEMIPKFLEKYREGFEIVSGVKTGVARRSWFIEMLAGLYYFLMRKLSTADLDPHASDFRLMDRRVVEALRMTRESTRFLRGLVKWLGFKSAVVPYEPAERFRGAPKYTLKKMFSLAGAGIFSFSVVPLRLATLTGVVTAVFAAIYASYALFARFFYNRIIEGWTSLMIVLLFMGSLQLIFLGVVGEYLGRVFLEVKRRPLYLVRNRVGTFQAPRDVRPSDQ